MINIRLGPRHPNLVNEVPIFVVAMIGLQNLALAVVDQVAVLGRHEVDVARVVGGDHRLP